MLSVKQGSIKYHFFSLWYDSTWDWTLLSQAISEHSTHLANGLLEKLYTENIFKIFRRDWLILAAY